MNVDPKLFEEFERYMRRSEADGLTVGKKDKDGNLLILGGSRVYLWQLASGLFEVAGEKFADDREAMKAYNQFNNTNLSLDYVRDVFFPWYEKQFKVVTEIQSATSDKRYTIRRDPNGQLICECAGFRFRKTCWHTDYIKAAEKGG